MAHRPSTDDTAHAPRERPGNSRSVTLDAGGPRPPFRSNPGGTRGVAALVPPGELTSSVGGPGYLIEVLPNSMRASTFWPVAVFVNVTATRLLVPSPLLVTT